MDIRELDLSVYSEAKPENPVHLLFIHHPDDGLLMAGPGRVNGESGILRTHPGGGGLRQLLGQNNYVVHEASHGSRIGSGTDVCHWNRKFRDNMQRILATRHQDMLYTDGTRNRAVMFQPGPSSSWIDAAGAEPGNPDSREKTLANYRAAYLSLLNYFRKEPDTLFIAVTPCALVKPEPAAGIIGRFLGGRDPAAIHETGKRIRSFNNWLKNVYSGWLHGYALKNVVVFDYYDILTAHGISNWLRYVLTESKDGRPSAEGNAQAAREFIPFINRALNRMAERASPFSTVKQGDFMRKASAR